MPENRVGVQTTMGNTDRFVHNRGSLAQNADDKVSGSTHCPECGQEIRRDDQRCPSCKATREVFNGHDGLGGLFVILGLLLGASGVALFTQERLRILGTVAVVLALVSALFGRRLLLKWRIYRW